MNQSTKAYDFYLYLRGGHLIPIQDATANMTNTTAQLQQMGVDFHVSPKAGVNGTWTSAGHYYNDNGTVLDLEGNGNLYLLEAAGNVSEANFTVQVRTLQSAYLHNVLMNNTNCSAVNKNDYLGNITLYNAKNFAQMTNLVVYAISLNATNTSVGTASYNMTTERLVTNINATLCLSTLSLLSFELPAPVPAPTPAAPSA
jgi:hypothetical protein